MSTLPANDPADPDREAAPKQAQPQPIPKAKRTKPIEAEPKAAPARNKPFSMSYGGVTNAEHIANMIARGAR